MTKEELTVWFNEAFWLQYQEFVKTPFPTKYKAGAKGEALKKVLTLKPSEALRDRIIRALVEQKKHRYKLFSQAGSMQHYLELTAFNKFYANRMASTWINQMGWEDEIPPLDEVESDGVPYRAEGRCSNDDCVNPVHGPNYIHCTQCLSRTGQHNEELKTMLRKMGLGKSKEESTHDYAMRCKQKAQQLMRGMIGRPAGG